MTQLITILKFSIRHRGRERPSALFLALVMRQNFNWLVSLFRLGGGGGGGGGGCLSRALHRHDVPVGKHRRTGRPLGLGAPPVHGAAQFHH